MYDVIVIGAGPAGLTSALYLRRANKKVLVLESQSYGGQIINASKIENYPGIEFISGIEFATNLYNQVIKLGAEIKLEKVIEVKEDKTVITKTNEYKSKALIIATGSTNRKLNIDKEDYFIGKGLSYCATCDGNFFKNKVVAINGGGNTALEDAIYMSNLASKVYVIHRRSEFRGDSSYLNILNKKSNVEFILNSYVVELIGENKLEKIVVKDNFNNTKELDVNGLFVAIGQVPKNEIFKNLVDLSDDGYIVTNDGVHTKTDYVYAAGDTRVKSLRQLTTAVSDGSIAANTAIVEMREMH